LIKKNSRQENTTVDRKTAASFTSERKFAKNAKSYVSFYTSVVSLIEASGGCKGKALERRFHLIFRLKSSLQKRTEKETKYPVSLTKWSDFMPNLKQRFSCGKIARSPERAANKTTPD